MINEQAQAAVGEEKPIDESKAIGGYARAQALSPEERREIAKKAALSRWNADVPQSIYTGTLTIGDMSFPCSVLSDGTRILTQSDFMTGMGMYYSGWVAKNRTAEDAAADMPHFLSFKSIKPFVEKHLGDLQSIIVKYRTERGKLAHGIKAEIIPKICDVWIDADEQEKLGSRQKKIAHKARILMRALAHVGIIALVDEVTGYQEVRDRSELHKILEAYIAKEFLPWTKRFPDEYYKQLFRLQGWSYSPLSTKRPKLLSFLTSKLVYEKLPPGVLEELRRRNPVVYKDHRRKHRHHSFLTQDIGNPHLEKQVASVTTLMRVAPTWKTFRKLFERAFPSDQVQGELWPEKELDEIEEQTA
jgi:hypothetical protein